MQAPARSARRLALILLAAGFHLAFAGCAVNRSAGDQLTAAEMTRNSQKLAGVWEGTTVSDCHGMSPCIGLRHITFAILPNATGGLDGFYRCERITSGCKFYNDRGLITSASVNRRVFSANIELQDDQECIFRSLAEPVEMEGRFFCKQRAIEVDRGVWRAERTF
jgi:hypothetical protein